MADFPTSAASFGLSKLARGSSLAQTTLASGISGSATLFSITSATTKTTWPTANFVVRIEDELIFCDSRSGTTNTVNPSGRGYAGTTAASHNAGVNVTVVFDSTTMEYIEDELEAISKVLKGTLAGSLDIDGSVTATEFHGNGANLDGITGATGGVSNTGTTTVGADTDEDGSGEVALQTRNVTRATIENGGKVRINSGTLVWTNLGAGDDPEMVSNAADQRVALTGTFAATAFEGDGSALTDLPSGSFSGVVVSRDADESLSAGNEEVLSWNVEEIKSDAGYHDNVTNPSRLIAISDGVYEVTATVEWSGTSSTSYRTQFKKNGTDLLEPRYFGPATSVATHHLSKTLTLDSGGYVEVEVEVLGSFSASVKASSGATMRRIGDAP